MTPEWKRWRWVGGGRRPTPSHRGREQTILTGSLSRRFARPLNHVCPARGARTPERAGTPPPPRQKTPPSRIFRPIETHLQQPSPLNSDAALQVQPRCKWHASASTSSRAPPDPPHLKVLFRVTALRPVTLQLVKISFDLFIILKQSNSAQTQTFPTPK